MSHDTKAQHIARFGPHRWAVEAKRAEVIERYLRIPRPTARDADAHAALIDMKRSAFYRLVRIFVDQADELRTGLSKNTRSLIDPRIDEIIRRVIEERPNQGLNEIAAQVYQRCLGEGLPPPSSNAVRNRFHGLRHTGDLPTLVVDHCPLRLAIRTESGAVAPAILTVLIHTPSARILGHHLDTHAGISAVANALNAALQPISSLSHQETISGLQYEIDLHPAWEPFATALMSVGIKPLPLSATERSRGKAVMRFLGEQLGPLKFAPRIRDARNEPTASLEQTRSVVAELITQNNASLQIAEPCSLRAMIGTKHALVLAGLLAPLITHFEAESREDPLQQAHGHRA